MTSSPDAEIPVPHAAVADSGQSPRSRDLGTLDTGAKRHSMVSLIDLDARNRIGISDSSQLPTARSDSASSADSGSIDLERKSFEISAPHSRNLRAQRGLAVKLPLTPAPPSTHVMMGQGTREDVKYEFLRLISSMAEHLQFTDSAIKSHPVRPVAYLSRGGVPLSS